MQTKHLCVLIHIQTKVEVDTPQNCFRHSSKIFLLTVPRWYFCCGSFSNLYLVFVMLSRPCIAALWSPEGKGLTLLALACNVYCNFVTFLFGILGQVCYLILSFPDPCYKPIPHESHELPRIDKYLDSWLNRTQFVKILTDSHSP